MYNPTFNIISALWYSVLRIWSFLMVFNIFWEWKPNQHIIITINNLNINEKISLKYGNLPVVRISFIVKRSTTIKILCILLSPILHIDSWFQSQNCCWLLMNFNSLGKAFSAQKSIESESNVFADFSFTRKIYYYCLILVLAKRKDLLFIFRPVLKPIQADIINNQREKKRKMFSLHFHICIAVSCECNGHKYIPRITKPNQTVQSQSYFPPKQFRSVNVCVLQCSCMCVCFFFSYFSSFFLFGWFTYRWPWPCIL